MPVTQKRRRVVEKTKEGDREHREMQSELQENANHTYPDGSNVGDPCQMDVTTNEVGGGGGGGGKCGTIRHRHLVGEEEYAIVCAPTPARPRWDRRQRPALHRRG